jgi:hypothetical protein
MGSKQHILPHAWHNQASPLWNQCTAGGSPWSDVFACGNWLTAWERTTVEEVFARRYLELRQEIGSSTFVPLYLVGSSPFWQGYERDARVDPIWTGPVVFLPSLYTISGSLNSVGAQLAPLAVDLAIKQTIEWRAEALLVTNLEANVSMACADHRKPNARVRLDATCRLEMPDSIDDYFASLKKGVRSDLRRRVRRAKERGVTFRELNGAAAMPFLPRFLELATASAVQHDMPVFYDLQSLQVLTYGPGARLFVAERDSHLLAGIYAFERNGCLVLWAGGIDYSALREFSPYVFLIHEIVLLANARGWKWVDFGRSNFDFKSKFGFIPVDLWSHAYLFGPSDQASRLRKQLTAMHDRIARFMFSEHPKLQQ